MPVRKKKKAVRKEPVKKRKQGRPSAYSAKMAERILAQVSSTTKGLETICKQHRSFPHPATIRRWIAENLEGFRDRYAHAKEEQADLMADEILDIADALDTVAVTHEKVSAAKLRVDARKWVASKLKPKKYGDKIDHTSGGETMNGFLGLLMKTSNDG